MHSWLYRLKAPDRLIVIGCNKLVWGITKGQQTTVSIPYGCETPCIPIALVGKGPGDAPIAFTDIEGLGSRLTATLLRIYASRSIKELVNAHVLARPQGQAKSPYRLANRIRTSFLLAGERSRLDLGAQAVPEGQARSLRRAGGALSSHVVVRAGPSHAHGADPL